VTDPAVREALADLLVGYALAVDDRDWARYASLFTSDAVVDYTKAWGPTMPASQMGEWMAANLTLERLPACQHLLSNIEVALTSAGSASGRAGYLNADVVRDQGRTILRINGGTYRASFSFDGGGWRIAHLAAELLWSFAPDPATTVFPMFGAAPPRRPSSDAVGPVEGPR
jgi:3-phenylpropionate/cinnamic acid dioxygenase small subunit